MWVISRSNLTDYIDNIGRSGRGGRPGVLGEQHTHWCLCCLTGKQVPHFHIVDAEAHDARLIHSRLGQVGDGQSVYEVRKHLAFFAPSTSRCLSRFLLPNFPPTLG